MAMICNWYDRCYFAHIDKCHELNECDCSIATAFAEQEKREEFECKNKGSN